MSPILLDTHVAIWSTLGIIPEKAGNLVDEAATGSELLLSPITAWEIGLLVSRGRFAAQAPLEDYVRTMFSRPGVVTATLTPAIAAASTLLPDAVGKDPADRILIATAQAYGARLMTRDDRIQAFAKKTGLIDCIAC